MMLSKPTIVTENSNVYDYINNGTNGYIIKKTNKELEIALQRLEDNVTYNNISTQARSDYETRFSEYALGQNIGNMITDKQSK